MSDTRRSTDRDIANFYKKQFDDLRAELAAKDVEIERLSAELYDMEKRATLELAEMTADRDSESRWAAQYLSERDEARAEVDKLRIQYDLAYELAMDEREEGKKSRAEVERLRAEIAAYIESNPVLRDWKDDNALDDLEGGAQ